MWFEYYSYSKKHLTVAFLIFLEIKKNNYYLISFKQIYSKILNKHKNNKKIFINRQEIIFFMKMKILLLKQ